MGSPGWRTAMAVALALLLAMPTSHLGPPPMAHAASTFVVNSPLDEADGSPGDGRCSSTPSSFCTLRAAMMEANALAGPDVVSLPPNRYQLSIQGREEDLGATGDLDVTADVRIVGTGAATTIVDARGIDRVFHVANGASVTMSGLTITGGYASQPGDHLPTFAGGVLNAGSLTLTDVAVIGNSVFSPPFLTRGSTATGGGILSSGTLVLEGGILERNQVFSKQGGGGALHNVGTASLRNVTISSNLVDVTQRFSSGGGILNQGSIALTNVTLYENRAQSSSEEFGGQSIENLSSAGPTQPGTRLRSTLVARGRGGNCRGTITSEGNNLDSGDSCGFNQPGDLNNTDPRLAPLADNGGPTQTHALLPDSPAIDRGADRECPATDQRRVGRPQDGDGDGRAACDIGAFERQDPARRDLAVAKLGPGGGTVTSAPAGIDCGTDCAEAYPVGTQVTLAATPAAGSAFGGWGGACTGRGVCQVAMDVARTVTASFEPAPTCTPRPPVRLDVARAAPGVLQATISATSAPEGGTNRLGALRFGRIANAAVEAAGQTGVTGGQTVTLLDGPTQTTVVVRRGPNGGSATVDLVVVDDCGEWRTFMGGGPSAF